MQSNRRASGAWKTIEFNCTPCSWTGLLWQNVSSPMLSVWACPCTSLCCRDNLRGFFEYCFPLLLKKIFGYDDREASWLYTVAMVRGCLHAWPVERGCGGGEGSKAAAAPARQHTQQLQTMQQRQQQPCSLATLKQVAVKLMPPYTRQQVCILASASSANITQWGGQHAAERLSRLIAMSRPGTQQQAAAMMLLCECM